MKRILACVILLITPACDDAAAPTFRAGDLDGIYIDSFNGAAIDRAAVVAAILSCEKQQDPPQRITIEWEGEAVGTGYRNVIHVRQTMLADFELLHCYTQLFAANGGIKIPE
jgi:hypothetical protein